MLKKLSFKTVL